MQAQVARSVMLHGPAMAIF